MSQDRYEIEKPSGEEADKATAACLDATMDRMAKDYHPGWRRHMAMIEGNHWQIFDVGANNPDDVSASKPRDFITVNESGANFDRMMTFLMRQNPKILCRPKKPEDYVAAMLQEAAINQEWKDKDCQSQLEQATRFCVGTGNGFLEVGFRRETDEELYDARQGSITYEEYIKEESVYLEAKDPFCILYDLEAKQKNLDTARWCAEIFFAAPGDVFNNKTYQAQGSDILNKIKSGHQHPLTVGALLKDGNYLDKKFAEMYDNDRDRFVLVKWWDKKWRTRKIYIKGIDKPILTEQWYDHMEGFPLIHQRFIDLAGKNFGVGLVDWIEDQQYELDRTRTHMFYHRRRITGGKYAYSADILPENMEAFKKGALALETPSGRTPREFINAIEYPQLSPDEYAIEERIKDDIRNMTAINEMMRGGNLPSRTSATEVNTRATLASAILDARAAVVDRTVVKAVRMMLAHMKAFYYKERIVEFAGPAGEYWGQVSNEPPGPDGRYWAPYTKEQIQAECDIEIETTSAPRVDPVMEKQQDLQELQIFLGAAPTLAQLGVPFNLAEYIRSYLNKHGDKDAARYYPLLRIIQAPIQTQTEVAAAQQAQQTSTALPPQISPQQQSIGAQAAPLQSDLLGALGGGLANNGGY